jgi:hypothetical protein
VCLALRAETSIGGRRVARELDAIMAWRGKPGECPESCARGRVSIKF